MSNLRRGRVQVRRKVHRGKSGFSIVGTDALGRSGLSIFVLTREGAQRIADAYRQPADPMDRVSARAYDAHTDQVTREVFAEEGGGTTIGRRRRGRRGARMDKTRIPLDVLERRYERLGQIVGERRAESAPRASAPTRKRSAATDGLRERLRAAIETARAQIRENRADIRGYIAAGDRRNQAVKDRVSTNAALMRDIARFRRELDALDQARGR